MSEIWQFLAFNNFSFYRSCQIYDHKIFHNLFLLSFYVYRVCSNVSFFIPDIGNFYPFSFFLSLAKHLFILLIFSKNQLLVSLIFSITFFSILLILLLSLLFLFVYVKFTFVFMESSRSLDHWI